MRKKYRDIRKNIRQRKEKNKKIYKNVLFFLSSLKFDILLFYYSKEEEVDTTLLIKHFLSIGKKVALPRVEKDKIHFYFINCMEEVKKGTYGIWEPIGQDACQDFSNSICFVPAICFDKQNYRIGYGGGYYDRFLKNYTGISIGLSYQECIVDKIDVLEFDQKVDKVVTDEIINGEVGESYEK